jgi:hypothetical protein
VAIWSGRSGSPCGGSRRPRGGAGPAPGPGGVADRSGRCVVPGPAMVVT